MTAVLPTKSSGSVSWHEVETVYRRGSYLRVVTGLFVLWVWHTFPRLGWRDAWLVGVGILGTDMMAWGVRRWVSFTWLVWGTVLADAVMAFAAVWAFSLSPTTNAPALLTLVPLEILAYRRHWHHLLGAWGYLLVSGLGFFLLPAPTGHGAILPLTRVVFWVVADGILLGGATVLLGISCPERPSGVSRLTPREQEVFQLARTGLTVNEIAEKLHIEVSTVKTHLHHIHQKLGH